MNEFEDQCPMCGISPLEVMQSIFSGLYSYACDQADPETPAKDVEDKVRLWLADQYSKAELEVDGGLN